MSEPRQHHHGFPSDAALLKHYTRLELSTTPTSEADFASLLAANYHSMVPGWAQAIKGLKNCEGLGVDELRRANSSNEKQFQRYMDGTISIPLELMRPWLESLGEYQFDAKVALLRHNNTLPFEVPGHSVLLNMSAASGEYADFLKAMAPILTDNKLDERDAPFIPAALEEVDQLISVLSSMRHAMEKLTAKQSDDDQAPVTRLKPCLTSN